MPDLLEKIFTTEQFMPHGYCFLWQPELLWMHVISDITIAVAYFSIPITLYVLLKKNSAMIPYRWVFSMFAIFIFCCGITHVIELITLWKPIYYIEGIMKLLTAAASVATAVMMFPLLPTIIDQLKSINTHAEH